MNNWPYEFTAEYHRERILEEVEQIRLEKLAEKSRRGRPKAFGRFLLHIGDWMISIGKQLHQRYEVSGDQGISPTTH